MSFTKYTAIASLALIAACAPQQPLIKATPSGNAEGTIQNVTVEDASNRVIALCNASGLGVYDATPQRVLCGKVLTGGDAVLASLAIGNSYSTPPEQKVQFIIFRDGSGVKITTQQWIETQMAFGQTRRSELKANHQVNDLQRALNSIGAY
jgi:hypothetical protein